MDLTYQTLAANDASQTGYLLQLDQPDVLLILDSTDYNKIKTKDDLRQKIKDKYIGVIKGSTEGTLGDYPYEAKALLPQYLIEVNSRTKIAIDSIIDALPTEKKLTKPEPIMYEFRTAGDPDNKGNVTPTAEKIKLSLTENFYLQPETRLALEYGKELLSRVALRQYNLSQKDRNIISQKPLFEIFTENQTNSEFLRNWTIVVLASLNSTTIMSADPKSWMDPKVIKMQIQHGELAAAEINSLILKTNRI